jgi:pimeloyl-ACP methyl ester carboxylesterase
MTPDQTKPQADNGIRRRDFMAAGSVVGALMAGAGTLAAQATTEQAAKSAPIDLAEWSFLWVGVDTVDIARGAVINGKQMYVEYQIPAEVKHPFPIVLVHGGGGQGLDWMGTPDGRPGWANYLVGEGYKVYVVDRPGHGRSPFHPDLDGPFPAKNITLEQISGLFTPQRAKSAQGPAAELAKLHNQWPGTGAVGTPELAQLVASQGGSFVANQEITQ